MIPFYSQERQFQSSLVGASGAPKIGMTTLIINDEVTMVYADWGCMSYFWDGTEYGAHAHDTHHYHVISHRSGYGDDIWKYAREHEVIHHLVGEYFFDAVSPIVWNLAHGLPISPEEAVKEEALVMLVQRWVRANERPIIGGFDWDALKERALGLLGE